MEDRDRSAVVLMTHFLDDGIVERYRRLERESGGRDVVVLYNAHDDPAPGFRPPPDVNLFPFGDGDIRGLGYPAKGRRLCPQDVELFVVNFHRRNPSYRHVWIVEYDVEFTGPWQLVFDHFAASGADLLATTVCRHAVNPAWENWRGVAGPGGPPPPETLLRAFFPFYRISARALAILHDAYAEGWHGHYEATVPTILAAAGNGIEDIGGSGEFVAPGNHNRFYTNTPAANSLDPGTFVFRPVRNAPGAEPNRLWHPVKPAGHAHGWRTGRRAVVSRRAEGWARSGMTRLGRLWAR